MEEDNDELLQCTDDESLSENEDQCLPIDKPDEISRQTVLYVKHTKTEFLCTKILLIISASLMLNILPLYMDSINVRGDVYAMILTTSVASTLIFSMALIVMKMQFKDLRIFYLPLNFLHLLYLSVIYAFCAFSILYALDRKRVLCHLQDPIKGIVLICSLLYYFFFCNKLMGLQRIFSSTTIIVGLFIAVDYGLCDEFRCRGYEREHISDDTGNWPWQVHSVWTAIYILGLALFSAYYSLLERYILAGRNDLDSSTTTIPSSLLSTVSRSIAYPSTNSLSSTLIPRGKSGENSHLSRKYSIIHFVTWLHLFTLVIVIALFWTDFIPSVGKGSNSTEFRNNIANGISCHFQAPGTDCANVVISSWIFIFSYVVFVWSSIKFLILTQSAVYTVATMTTALPLAGVWWSLVHMDPDHVGFLVWSPSITGELICSLLGLPIILVGLCLLAKSHFKDYQLSKTNSGCSHVIPANSDHHLA